MDDEKLVWLALCRNGRVCLETRRGTEVFEHFFLSPREAADLIRWFREPEPLEELNE